MNKILLVFLGLLVATVCNAQPSSGSGPTGGGSGSGDVTSSGNNTFTGANSFDNVDAYAFSHQLNSLGTIAGAGTATLVATNTVYLGTFSGSTATIALPGSPKEAVYSLYGINTYSGGEQVITIPSLRRVDFDIDTDITTVTNAASTDGFFALHFVVVNGAFERVVVEGDAWTPDSGGDTIGSDSFTSAELRTSLSDESGTGAAIFAGGAIGAATATTATKGDNTTLVATTAFVRSETQRTVYINAGAMIPNTTAGAASGTAELATNDIMVDSMDFDASTDEFVGAWFTLPTNFVDGSNVGITFHWTAASGSGDVYWTAGIYAFDDDSALDQSVTLATAAADTLLLANDLHIGPTLSAQAIGGTDNAGDLCYIKISRDADNGSDTLAVDAKLLGVTITF